MHKIVRLKVCTKVSVRKNFKFTNFSLIFNGATTKIFGEAQFLKLSISSRINTTKSKNIKHVPSSFSRASSSMYTCIEVASFELFLRYIRIENVSACCVNSSDLQLHLKTVTVR